jgi:hypothetical protein
MSKKSLPLPQNPKASKGKTLRQQQEAFSIAFAKRREKEARARLHLDAKIIKLLREKWEEDRAEAEQAALEAVQTSQNEKSIPPFVS